MAYWEASAAPLDFASTDIDTLDESCAIALIKLTRLCVQRLDDAIAASMLPAGVLTQCTRYVVGGGTDLSNQQVLAAHARKVAALAKRDFQLTVTPEASADAVVGLTASGSSPV
jgi:hypothetical protein